MFTIYRPVRSNNISQGFGDNKAFCKLDDIGKLIRPFQIVGGSTCPPGYMPFYQALGMRGHNGQADFSIWNGEAVYFNVEYPDMRWFAKSEVDADGGVGLRVYSLIAIPFTYEELPKQVTKHILDIWEKQEHKLHVSFLYWHLKDIRLSDKPKVQIGTFSDGRPEMAYEVKAGDLIALGDSTGASSAPHVHFSAKFCLQNTMTIGNDNGYAGAVDFSSFYENDFIGDIIAVEEQALTVIQQVRKFIGQFRK